MPVGPCIVCGDTNYPASMGGPNICPSCDCGIDPKVKKLESELTSLRAENSSLRVPHEKYAQMEKDWDKTVAELRARITQLEVMIENIKKNTHDQWVKEVIEVGQSLSKPSSSMEVNDEKG